MVDKFKDITEEEIDTFLEEFMKANFNIDDDKDSDYEWCCTDPGSLYGQMSFDWNTKKCPRCKSEMEQKDATSFNGDKFKVWKCSNPKCGYCE
jgi:isopentenyldiphosphate isomerase